MFSISFYSPVCWDGSSNASGPMVSVSNVELGSKSFSNKIKQQSIFEKLMLFSEQIKTLKIASFPKKSLLSVIPIIKTCKNLQLLDLNGSKLSELNDTAWAELCDSFQGIPILNLIYTELHLLGTARLRSLCETLKQCENLQTLNLTGNDLSLLDIPCQIMLFETLKECPKLKTLELSYTNLFVLESSSWTFFCETLKQYQDLQSLSLTGIEWPELKPENRTQLYAALRQCKKLKKMDLSYTNLDLLKASDWTAFCTSLQQCPQFETLTLYGISDLGTNEKKFQALIKMIQESKRLNTINGIENLPPAKKVFLVTALANNLFQVLNAKDEKIPTLRQLSTKVVATALLQVFNSSQNPKNTSLFKACRNLPETPEKSLIATYVKNIKSANPTSH